MKKGFTIIELLIVIGIIIIAAAAALPIYSNLQVSSQLNETNAQIAQTIKNAREKSVAGLNNSRHGVKFNPSSYTLFQGDSYATRESLYDRTIDLDDVLTITTNLTNDEIVFARGSGIPNNTGIITLNHDVQGSRTVTINEFGLVDEN